MCLFHSSDLLKKKSTNGQKKTRIQQHSNRIGNVIIRRSIFRISEYDRVNIMHLERMSHVIKNSIEMCLIDGS